jgi:pre-mRNA-splicing factor CWC22
MDKTTHEYQRMHWDALKKSLNGKINKINKSNFQVIVRELFQDNIKRGRGLLARNIIQAQLVSPFYTPVYTALVSFINTKFSEIGELIVRRLISIFRHTYQRNDKTNCLSTIKFLGHLVNENVLHDRILLQMLVLLLENKTDDRVELAVELIKECEQQLSHVNPSELDLVFATLRNLLHDASLKKRTKYMIEALFAEPKNPIIQPGLDLVDNSYQFTHIITLLGTCAPEIILGK